MADGSSGTDSELAPLLGLTPNRLRGIAAILFLLAMVYFAIFESDPPPVFTEVEIEIPAKPLDRFDEKTIVLPDFDASPLDGGEGASAPAAGVRIAKVDAAEQQEPRRATPQDGDVRPNPAGVRAAVEAKVEAAEVVAPLASDTPVLPPGAGSGFFVQVLALTDAARAKQVASELGELLGEPTYTQRVSGNDKPIHRVRVGPYGADRGKANEVLNRLREENAAYGEQAFVDED